MHRMRVFAEFLLSQNVTSREIKKSGPPTVQTHNKKNSYLLCTALIGALIHCKNPDFHIEIFVCSGTVPLDTVRLDSSTS